MVKQRADIEDDSTKSNQMAVSYGSFNELENRRNSAGLFQEIDKNQHLIPVIEEKSEPEVDEVDLDAKHPVGDGADSSSSDEEENGQQGTKNVKKRTMKLKKSTETRTTFDGRKVLFVTYFTQTDWRWKDRAESTGQGKLLSSRTAKLDSRQTSGRTHTGDDSARDDRTVTDLSPFSLQPNDEFGLPLTDDSSDSDTSEDGSPKKSRDHRSRLPTVGPPLILKYIRESDLAELDKEKAEQERIQNNVDLVLDEDGKATGMFGGTCEFCGAEIKPFPTLEQQLSHPPESLYCCEDYREFIEFAMTTANRLEEDVTKRNEMISVKVHGHHGSKQARQMAKEKAVQRMHERELQRRQQEASGLRAASFQYSNMFQDDDGYLGADQTEESYPPGADQPEAQPKKSKKKTGDVGKGEGGEGVAEAGGVSGRAEKKVRGSISESVGHGSHLNTQTRNPGQASFSTYGALNMEGARQMKTINYQLSSQRCLEEGWTLRAPSPLEQGDDNEMFVPEPLHPAMIATGKLHGRQLIQKFYPDGSTFLTMFPDGTGHVFYPSGRLAISIISVSLGHNTYIVQDDTIDPHILAVFEPSGLGSCYFANGKMRLNYDQLGGIELDYYGARRKNWSWRDQETHVHAPPFQPIVFGMNRHVGIRFMAQETIALTLTGKKRSCRFNVGARLKMVGTECPSAKPVDENQLILQEVQAKVNGILSKVSNLLKFPKSPKVDAILPPISVASQQQKVDKKRQLYNANLSNPRNKLIKQNKLPPLDQPTVSVN
ncbi:glutamate-rich protein 6-like isoform X2 [Physella acuta]|uniref:glutamate-rich protein 6-like isoform X2 n=1 Tax=Physella acuta TaxID=109671 RepID=UPI0027DD8B81|nr:glutamate-rich protein 6-like isoform X2 [Physella acuta]